MSTVLRCSGEKRTESDDERKLFDQGFSVSYFNWPA